MANSSPHHRHSEKNTSAKNVILSKPGWLRVKAPTSNAYDETRQRMRNNRLHTVCEEAACPNIGECWAKGHATMMILGDICTRACAFCNVATGKPGKPDSLEPENVGIAIKELGLKHVVITSVDRDDLPDGGAEQFAETICATRLFSPETTVEVLVPDFRGKAGALETVIMARPAVLNHNVETVPRLYPTIRPGARYYNSLRLLDRGKLLAPATFTKSGIMVGLGEERVEVMQVMDDLRSAGVDFLTIGQYLQPTPKHAPVKRYISPKEFEELKAIGLAKGFSLVASSPLTRSSYHADADFAKLRKVDQATLK